MIPLFRSAEGINWSNINTHNKAVSTLLEEYSNAEKKKYTDLFLHNLHEPYSNGALYSLAICKTFPLHEIGELNSQENCNICDSKADIKPDFVYQRRLTASFEGTESGDRNLYSLLLMLKTVNLCEEIATPTATDYAILKQILSILDNKNITMQEAISQIKKCDFVKQWNQFRKKNMKMQGKPTKNITVRSQIKLNVF